MKRLTSCLGLIAVLLGINPPAVACFAVVAGRGATADGAILVAHNEQNDPPRQFLNFHSVPRRVNTPGAQIHLRNGGSWPDVPEAYGFLWSEVFGSTGSDGLMNEWGVVFVSNASRKKDVPVEELVRRGDLKDGGIGWMLRVQVARRCRTAREGIEVVGQLMSRFGYAGGGVTLIIADPGEAWVVSLARGPRWAARRVPDDAVVVIANTNVIGIVDPRDEENVILSPGLIEFAAERGWYDPGDGRPFDFKAAYDDPAYGDNWFASKFGCDPRRWRGQCLVRGEEIPLPLDGGLPFSVKPRRKLSVADLRAILSDHLEGTTFDRSDGYRLGSPHDLMGNDDGMICSQANQEAAVFQLRSWLPPEVGCVYWRTTAAGCSSPLTPWYAGITDTPGAYHKYGLEENLATSFHFQPPAGTFEYDGEQAFWVFNTLENLVDIDYRKAGGPVREAWTRFEEEGYALQPGVERQALALLASDRELGRAYLTAYCSSRALQALDTARGLNRKLMGDLFGY